jgi:3D-(3,5/4)-trihydroxycyclohexane-1,2-dione acylhydrolase (decyclizing)
VFVLVGDGSYLMLNSEIATAVRLGVKLTIVLLDNGGFGCIERLQQATGNASFNNLLGGASGGPDFAAHARALGAEAVKVPDLAALAQELTHSRAQQHTTVLVIETDPAASTAAGGCWWDVPVPAVSARAEVRAAREHYLSSGGRRSADS